MNTLQNHYMYVFFTLFDAQVQPIVLYGAETYMGNWTSIVRDRKVTYICHVEGLVSAELGTYPIYINAHIR